MHRNADGAQTHVETTHLDAARCATGRRTGYLYVIRDITESVIADQRAGADGRGPEDADRRKDEFLATLAHELRNPLAPDPQRAAASCALAPDAAGQGIGAQHDRAAGGQMVRLVDDLLDVTRISQGKMELRTSGPTWRPVVQARGGDQPAR